MFTLRLATDAIGPDDADFSLSAESADRQQMMLWAVPTQQAHSMRIPVSIGLTVERLGHDGIEVFANEALMIGSRLTLSFPKSPFLPRSGIIARVDDCYTSGNLYAVRLSYEAASVA